MCSISPVFLACAGLVIRSADQVSIPDPVRTLWPSLRVVSSAGGSSGGVVVPEYHNKHKASQAQGTTYGMHERISCPLKMAGIAESC